MRRPMRRRAGAASGTTAGFSETAVGFSETVALVPSGELFGDARPDGLGRRLELADIHAGTPRYGDVAQRGQVVDARLAVGEVLGLFRRRDRLSQREEREPFRDQCEACVTSSRVRIRSRLRRMWLLTVPSGMSSLREIS